MSQEDVLRALMARGRERWSDLNDRGRRLVVDCIVSLQVDCRIRHFDRAGLIAWLSS